jgi:hypothetical protein
VWAIPFALAVAVLAVFIKEVPLRGHDDGVEGVGEGSGEAFDLGERSGDGSGHGEREPRTAGTKPLTPALD